jgi:hypothetical protein
MWQKNIAVAVVALIVPTAVHTQQWSSAQLEVWNFEQSCWQKFTSQDMEGFRTCFHRDYVG